LLTAAAAFVGCFLFVSAHASLSGQSSAAASTSVTCRFGASGALFCPGIVVLASRRNQKDALLVASLLVAAPTIRASVMARTTRTAVHFRFFVLG